MIQLTYKDAKQYTTKELNVYLKIIESANANLTDYEKLRLAIELYKANEISKNCN